jgi:hypothetical protein
MLDDGITLDTSELDGFADRLGSFALEVQDKMLKQAVAAGAEVFMFGVMAKCPVDTDRATGESNQLKPGMLKADIRVAIGKTGRRCFIGAGPTTAYVMRWLERGHLLVKGGTIAWTNGKRSRRGKGGHVIGHVPAHPVLRPAFDQYNKAAVHAFAEELELRIRAYWKKAGRRASRAA